MRHFKRRLAALALLCLLSGCGAGREAAPEAETPPAASAHPQPTQTPKPTQTPPASEPVEPVSAADESQLKAALKLAMEELRPELTINIGTWNLGPEPELAVRNIYYELTGETPRLKYTYDIEALYNASQQTIHVAFSYMPYATGTQSQEESLCRIGTIKDLISAAERGLGQESIGIYIQNSDLDVDTMSLALGQVGGGWIMCSLNRDATEILFRPADGRTMEDCLSNYEKTNALADALLAQLCTDDMPQEDKLEALYTYLTQQVRYDQRYYADPQNMPYESTTAYGALRDGMAICGGYAQALQLLSHKIGVECYTVSGRAGGENHMWNVIRLNGEWKFYDPTYDRGRAEFGFNWYGVEEETLTPSRSWNQQFLNALIADEKGPENCKNK